MYAQFYTVAMVQGMVLTMEFVFFNLVVDYDVTSAYGGLQCDGIHFGKSGGGSFGCAGFPVVTDVVVQILLNKLCMGVQPAVGCKR